MTSLSYLQLLLHRHCIKERYVSTVSNPKLLVLCQMTELYRYLALFFYQDILAAFISPQYLEFYHCIDLFISLFFPVYNLIWKEEECMLYWDKKRYIKGSEK